MNGSPVEEAHVSSNIHKGNLNLKRNKRKSMRTFTLTNTVCSVLLVFVCRDCQSTTESMRCAIPCQRLVADSVYFMSWLTFSYSST